MKLFHYLGSIYFAILLIAVTAIFVVTGTVLESKFDSHLYAARFTYNNPVFTALLGCYFINILFSALRRWPFKPKHIPFLITHFGLLMILMGVIVKNIWGIQGALAIWEGSGSHHVMLANTQAIDIKEKDKRSQISLEKLIVLNYAPHAEEKWESWIKDNHLIIAGLPPIPITQQQPAVRIRVESPQSEPWPVYINAKPVIFPALQFQQTPEGDIHFFAYDSLGEPHQETFLHKTWNKLIAYDHGYGGYFAQAEIPFIHAHLECPLTLKYKPLPPQNKLEDNRPAIKFEWKGQKMVLGYDPTGEGLRWPTPAGDALLRFQPRIQDIPYHVRVREARQITYANSTQPYSYECDILINGKEITLSMNQVHETWDGYRFYLASITPETTTDAKRVTIIVNKDPAKYILTYPGAGILSLGIILLFWLGWDEQGRPKFRTWAKHKNDQTPPE